jgi:hypothetical protein
MRKIRYELNGKIYNSTEDLLKPINDINSDVSLEEDKDGKYYVLPNKGGLSFIDELNSDIAWVDELFKLELKIMDYRPVLDMKHISILPMMRMEIKKFEKQISRIEMYLSDDYSFPQYEPSQPEDPKIKIISSALKNYSFTSLDNNDSILAFMYDLHIRIVNMPIENILKYDNALSRLVGASVINYNPKSRDEYIIIDLIKSKLSNIISGFK